MGNTRDLHSEDIEKFVLGTIIANPALFISISDLFRPELFYYPHHGKIAEIVVSMNEKGIPCDALNMIPLIKGGDMLQAKDLIKHILELGQSNLFIPADTLEVKTKLLYELYLRRKGQQLANKFNDDCESPENDVFDVYAGFSEDLMKSIDIQKDNESPMDRLQAAYNKSKIANEAGTGVSGLSFGLVALDRLGGASGGDLIIVAGYPGTFKTGLTMQIADNFCNNNVPTLFFEMEMSKEQFGMRELAMYTGLSTHEIKTGVVNPLQYENMKNKIPDIAKRPLYVDFRSGLTIGSIKNKAKIFKAKKKIGAVVIDYLGLANLELRKYGGLEPAIDNFVRECKALAKLLDIPVILLAQFLKDNDGNKLKVPHSGLLKGSGAIEAHADIVLLTWNPSAVDPNFEHEVNGVRQRTEGFLGIVAAKNRQGSLGLGWVKAFPAVNRFTDCDGEIKFQKIEPRAIVPNSDWDEDYPF
jgi:replicative DNA helicase